MCEHVDKGEESICTNQTARTSTSTNQLWGVGVRAAAPERARSGKSIIDKLFIYV